MKHLFTIFFLSLFSLSITAQATFDYMLFRPGVQYLYDNPAPSNGHTSPILGMKLTPSADAFVPAYQSARVPENDGFSGCMEFLPSFAGLSIRQQNSVVSMAMDAAQTELVVLNVNAAVGQSWAATPTVTATVDSVITETLATLTDDVKHISFSRTSDGAPLARPIRISKAYGLLTGTFFRNLDSTVYSLTLHGLSSPEIGEQLPRFGNVLDIPVGTELNIHRQLGIRDGGPFRYDDRQQQLEVTGLQRDPVLGVTELFFRIQEFSFTVNLDDHLHPFNHSFRSDIDTFRLDTADYGWLNAQPGEVIYPTINWRGGPYGDPRLAVLIAQSDDCRGIGIGHNLPRREWEAGDGCWKNGQEGGRTGRFYKGLGGPYGTGGYNRTVKDDLIGAFGDDIDCGERYDLESLTETTTLGDPFDWQLYRPGVQYNFASEFGPRLTGIKVTGIGEETLPDLIVEDNEACPLNGISYFGRTIYQAADSTSIVYRNRPLILKPGAPVGSTWELQTGSTATVDSVREETFFGLTDSVKYISIATNFGVFNDVVLKVSKNFGALTAIDFEARATFQLNLAGMSEPAVGVQKPDFASITDFQPGDVIHRRFINDGAGDRPNPERFQTIEEQLTVEWVERPTFNLVYVYALKNDLTFYSPFADFGFRDSLYRENRREVLTFDLRDMPFLDYQFGQMYTDEAGIEYKVSPFYARCDLPNEEELGGIILDQLETSPRGCREVFPFATGGVFYNRIAGPYHQFVEGAYEINALNYRDNGAESCGTPLDFNGLVDGINDFQPDERIRLYPNPASDRVTIEIPEDLGVVSLRLISTDGRLVQSLDGGRGNQTVSLGNLPAGVYTVVVAGERSLVGRRRLVVR